MASAVGTKSGRLADVFGDLLVLGTYLKDTKDLGGPDHLRTRLHHLFNVAEEQGKSVGIHSDEIGRAHV